MAGNFDKLHEEELIMILKHVQCKYALYFTCKKLSELSLQIDIKDKNYELLVWSNIVSTMSFFSI